MKPSTTLVVADEPDVREIAYPSLTNQLEHEVELVIALATGGHDISGSDVVHLRVRRQRPDKARSSN